MTAVRRILAFTAPALVVAALTVVVFAGEGRIDLRSAGGGSEGCGVEPEPAIGYAVPIVRGFGDEYGVAAAVELPDGGVVFSRDANVPEAGGDSESRQPALIHLSPDGTCTPFPLPVVDGRPVAQDAQPAAADAEGQIYLWEFLERGDTRLVAGRIGGPWRTVAKLPYYIQNFFLDADVAADGTVYVMAGGTVWRAKPDANLELLVGTREFPDTRARPPVYPEEFPRPATSKTLPPLTSIAVAPDGDIYIAEETAILRLDGEGMLHLVTDLRTIRRDDDSVAEQSGDGGPLGEDAILSEIAVTESDDVIISDLRYDQIVRLRDAHASVIVKQARLMGGQPLDRDATEALVSMPGGRLGIVALPS